MKPFDRSNHFLRVIARVALVVLCGAVLRGDLDGSNVRNVRDFGAKGDGITDDTDAIRATLTAARESRPVADVYLPPGSYCHRDVVVVDGLSVRGDNAATTQLIATNPERSAWRLTGDGPGLSDLSFQTRNRTGPRLTTPNSAGVEVVNARHFSLQNIRVTGSASAGIIVRNSGGTANQPATIRGCEVLETQADGIHLTAGTQHVIVAGNRVRGTGDDFIAVVSYGDNAHVCSNITIQANDVADQHHGRGISVVGGQDVLIEQNVIRNSQGAGIYLSSESQYKTRAVTRITLRGNYLRNTAADTTGGHGAIQLIGRPTGPEDREGTVSDVLVDGNVVEGGARAGIWVGPFSRRVTLWGNIIAEVAGDAIGVGPEARDVTVGGPEQAATTANMVISCGGYGVYVDTRGAAGRLAIIGNRFQAINTRGQAHVDVIHLSRGNPYEQTVISLNRFDQPADGLIERYIESNVRVSTVADNSANVELTTYLRLDGPDELPAEPGLPSTPGKEPTDGT